MKKISLYFLVFVMGCGYLADRAQADQQNFDLGKSAAAYLNIPLGARQTSLAGSFVAIANDLGAITSNPAGLCQIKPLEIRALHSLWVSEIFFDNLAYGQRLMPGSAFGVSLTYFNFGSLDKYVVNATGDPVADGFFTPYVLVANAAYGHKVMSKLALGLSLKGMMQQIDTTNSSAFAADLGALYFTGVKGWTAGITLANIGGQLDESDLPLKVRLGTAYQMPLQMIGADTLLLTLESVLPVIAVESTSVLAGAEYICNNLLALRLGYKADQDAELGGLDGLSAGLGVHYQMLQFDFAFTSLGILGESYQLGVSAGF